MEASCSTERNTRGDLKRSHGLFRATDILVPCCVSPGLPKRKNERRTEHAVGNSSNEKCSPSLASETTNWRVAGVVEGDRDRGLVVGD